MLKRKIHPKKEIEKAIQYAESKGWRYKKTSGSAHAWGRLLCPLQNREGCSMSIWSTPKIPETHAKQILKRVNSCNHEENQ